MFDILKFFSPEKKSSKNVAKERLKLVLVHDRADFPPHILEAIRSDMIEVIEKYMEIDKEAIELKMIKSKGESSKEMLPALIANIPVKNIRPSTRKSK